MLYGMVTVLQVAITTQTTATEKMPGIKHLGQSNLITCLTSSGGKKIKVEKYFFFSFFFFFFGSDRIFFFKKACKTSN